MKILLVDDSSVLRAIGRKALLASDLRFDDVVEAATATEALEWLAIEPTIGLVLSDAEAGPALVRAIRARGASVPVVVLATPSRRSDADAALAAGADGCASKPLTPESADAELAAFV